MDLERVAIHQLKTFEPKEGYCVAYSGGKDSEVLLDLVKKADVKFRAVYNLTGIDSPETVQHIKKHSEVEIVIPRFSDGTKCSMWQLIRKNKIPPTRLMRFCCKYLKEDALDIKNEILLTGVRADESQKRKENASFGLIKNNKSIKNDSKKTGEYSRKKFLSFDENCDRRIIESCALKSRVTMNPLINWTEKDIWDYIEHYHLKVNPLYQKGFSRVGCIGCPMAGKHRREQFKMYPQFYKTYLKVFDEVVEIRHDTGLKCTWKNGQDLMDWWLSK